MLGRNKHSRSLRRTVKALKRKSMAGMGLGWRRSKRKSNFKVPIPKELRVAGKFTVAGNSESAGERLGVVRGTKGGSERDRAGNNATGGVAGVGRQCLSLYYCAPSIIGV